MADFLLRFRHYSGRGSEKLGRRWIGCDLGRWGIHVSRKRMLGIENCKPFEILNLGKYERQYWQGATFGSAPDEPSSQAEQTISMNTSHSSSNSTARSRFQAWPTCMASRDKVMIHIGTWWTRPLHLMKSMPRWMNV